MKISEFNLLPGDRSF